MTTYEVAVIGGGPAGLQCALLLARARRSVVLFDSGHPRNETVREAHGFFTRDAIVPSTLLSIGRTQLERYPSVAFESKRVTAIAPRTNEFLISANGEPTAIAKRVVLATGMRDKLPSIEGLAACWGRSAFVCPYCDGWEIRDRPIAVWGNTRSSIELARELYQWTRSIVVCAAVETPIPPEEREWIERTGVRVASSSLTRLVHDDGALRSIEFMDGTSIACEALFMSVTLTQCCDIAERVGCRLTERGHISVDAEYRTSVPGIYAAGDVVTHMHQIVFAAASGARAAIAINNELTGIA